MEGERPPRRRGPRPSRGGAAVAVACGVVVLAYVLLHSPFAPAIDRLLGGSLDCAWRCGAAIPVLTTASALFCVAACALGGWGIVRLLDLDALDRAVAWGICSFALVTVAAAYLGGLDDLTGLSLLRPPLGPSMVALPALGALALSLRRRPLRRPGHMTLKAPRVTPLVALTLVVAACVVTSLILAIGVAVAHPPTGFDDLGYHFPIAVFTWRDGTISSYLARLASAWPLAQPGAAELWFGLLRLIGGEPLMVLGQLPFALLGAVAVGVFARRTGLSPRAALFGGLVFLTLPVVTLGVGRGLNDVVAAALLASAAALLAAPDRRWTASRIALVGLGLGLAITTKVGLLPGLVGLGLVLLWIVRPGVHIARRERLIGIASAFALGGVAVAPWWLRNVVLYHNPLYPLQLPLLPGVSQLALGGRDLAYVPRTLLWPLYPVISPATVDSGVGALFAAALIPGLVLALRNGRRRPLGILAAVAIVGIAGWWLGSRHEPRFLLDLVALVCAVVPFTVVAVRRRWQPAVVTALGAAAVVSAGLMILSGLASEAAAPIGRSAFYASVWKVDPQVLALPSSQGLLLDDRCAGGDRSNRIYPLLGDDQERVVASVDCRASAADAAAIMDRYHLTVAYVADPAQYSAAVDARYPPSLYTLVSSRTAPQQRHRSPMIFRLYRRVGAGG